ncbi:MAG: DNA polymerase III subunit alpha [Deltaproteobacteria bacterium]
MHHSNFVHLHLHSQWSLLDGAIRPEALISLCREQKMPAVAITDHGNIFGAIDFYQKAMANGIKPIIGSEIYVAPGSMSDKTASTRGETSFHLVLLVKNIKGYVNLCKLLSKAYIEGFYYRPRVDKELLSKHSEGLIALSACLHGEVAHYISTGRKDLAEKAAGAYKEIFPDRRFFLEIQDNGMQEQVRVNSALIALGKALDIPVVATNDCHYLEKKDARIHDILLCIQTGATVNQAQRMRFATDEFYVKSPREMTAAFKDVPEAISNTIEIAERCNVEFKLNEPHLPEFPCPAGETLDGFLEKKALEGLEKRFKHSLRDIDESHKWQYYERLKKEFNVIRGMGFSGYFLIVTDFIDFARSREISVGPGRGSAAGSLVAYCLGITNLDPIRYNLLFERFLNPDRISLPDIDIDFCFEKRDEVIRYVTQRYGPENVTQIITFGQLKAKACIRDVGRALDMPYSEVDRIAKLVPNHLNITIKDALKEEPRLKKLVSDDPRVKEMIDAAIALEGLPRHASTHAAGVVISNKPLVEYLPLYKGQKENIITTQFPMKDVEKIGLVKFDFLGLKTLTVIEKTIRQLKKNRAIEVDIDALALDDTDTYNLIASGSTNGIFQLESSGIKELLKKLKPETFEDLVAAVALYRPGPLQSGMVDDFINRKHKRTKITYEVPELKAMLENTYGVMVYQEQVMEIAKVLAGFAPGDADKLRKAMGKKLPEEMVEQRTKFLDGARGKNIPLKKAEKIFDLMAKFAGYGFNKSHSAAYALIAFQTAYLKAHYPTEFLASLLSSDMANTDQVIKYTVECKDLNIPIDQPDVNKSQKEFTVEAGRIRFGLGAIKNIGDAAIDEILRVRQDALFASLVDFLSRVDTRKVNKKAVEFLIKSGSFDSTGQGRSELLSSLEASMEAASGVQRDRDLGQQSIFEILGQAAPARFKGAPVAAPLPDKAIDKDILAHEKESLGFYLSSHPLEGCRDEMAERTTCPIQDIAGLNDRDEVSIGGMVSEVREISTKKGDKMAFVRIEDLTGSVEAVVFADILKKTREVISAEAPIVVQGRLDKGDDEVKIVAAGIVPLKDAKKTAKKTRQKNIHIRLSVDAINDERLTLLRDGLSSNPGQFQVFLHVVDNDGVVVVEAGPGLKADPTRGLLDMIKGVFADASVRVD